LSLEIREETDADILAIYRLGVAEPYPLDLLIMQRERG